MALKPSVRYAGQVAIDAAYPHGKARNVTTEGDGSGTPLEADLVNDLFGFQQSLLAAAAITPSNAPDEVGASQYLEGVQFQADMAKLEYNAKKLGASNLGVLAVDTVLDSIESSLVALGGGGVFFPPGRYRLSTSFVKRAISWRAIPGTVVVTLDTATTGTDLLSFSTGTYAADITIEGIDFEADQANIGAVFRNPSGTDARVVFRRCRVNASASNLGGRILYQEGGGSFAFEDCDMVAVATVSAFVGDEIRTLRGAFTMAPAGNALFAAGNRLLDIDGTLFRQTSTGAGGNAFISCTNTSSKTNLRRARFAVDDSGAGSGTYAMFVGASVIHTSDNDFTTVTPYAWGAPAATDSQLQLLPEDTSSITGSTYTIPNAVQVATLRLAPGATAPTVTMPKIFFKGQPLELTIFNATGGPLGFSLAGYGYKATFAGTPATSTGATARFVATDPAVSGSPKWVQMGEWAAVAA